MPTSFRHIIHSYSDMVFKGTSDDDLTKQQAYFTGVLLNLAANHPLAGLSYPLEKADRLTIRKWLNDFAWDAQGLFRNKQADDFSTALARALTCLENM